MKALVINLNDEKDRMDFQHLQLRSLGIDYERFPAYEISNPNDPVFLRYYHTWQRPLTLAEVSCFLSHKTVWEKVIEYRKPMFVIEDDAYLATNISCILSELDSLKGIDYINLETRYNRKRLISRVPEKSICASQLYRLYQGRSGTGGYILWPSGALKLLNKIDEEGIGIVDKFINSTYSMTSLQLSPAPLIQLDQCELNNITAPIVTSSSITSSKQKKQRNRSLFSKYTQRRIIGQLKIILNHLRHIRIASKKNIDISPLFYSK